MYQEVSSSASCSISSDGFHARMCAELGQSQRRGYTVFLVHVQSIGHTLSSHLEVLEQQLSGAET